MGGIDGEPSTKEAGSEPTEPSAPPSHGGEGNGLVRSGGDGTPVVQDVPGVLRVRITASEQSRAERAGALEGLGAARIRKRWFRR